MDFILLHGRLKAFVVFLGVAQLEHSCTIGCSFWYLAIKLLG